VIDEDGFDRGARVFELEVEVVDGAAGDGDQVALFGIVDVVELKVAGAGEAGTVEHAWMSSLAWRARLADERA
jgi:hypothetical protein